MGTEIFLILRVHNKVIGNIKTFLHASEEEILEKEEERKLSIDWHEQDRRESGHDDLRRRGKDHKR